MHENTGRIRPELCWSYTKRETTKNKILEMLGVSTTLSTNHRDIYFWQSTIWPTHVWDMANLHWLKIVTDV